MTQAIDTSTLEEAAKVAKETEEADQFEFDEEQLLTDLDEAVVLIQRAKTLFDYVKDPELCKLLSKKERSAMNKLSGKMKTYIDSIESNYGEIGSIVDHDLSV